MKFLLPVLVLCAFAIQTEAQEHAKKGDVYFTTDVMPEYPGGDDALRKDLANSVKYPVEAKQKGIQGKVYVTFVVDKNGKIIEPRIARGVDPILDKEALRVMGDLKTWTPGKVAGEPVKVSFTVPIKFALNDDCDAKKASKNDKMVFLVVEDMPEFPGGDDALRTYISEQVKYPEGAKKDSIQGKVYVEFVVAKDGGVTDAKIARGVDPLLDKESLRVVNTMPKWKPGKQRGEAVNVKFTVPINYVLN